MAIIEWLPHGFFVNRGLGKTMFIKYENIYQVEKAVLFKEEWNVSVDYVNPSCEESGFRFVRPTKEEAELLYDKILDNWKNFHRNSSTLQDKIIRFISHIEVLPGGEEYEKAKDRFQKTD